MVANGAAMLLVVLLMTLTAGLGLALLAATRPGATRR
jgi:hypothetical protein